MRGVGVLGQFYTAQTHHGVYIDRNVEALSGREADRGHSLSPAHQGPTGGSVTH
jgi:hypothetical protein